MGSARDLETVIKQFEKKFLDKTKNEWVNRDKFNPVPGNYMLLEMDDDSEGDEEEVRGSHASSGYDDATCTAISFTHDN